VFVQVLILVRLGRDPKLPDFFNMTFADCQQHGADDSIPIHHFMMIADHAHIPLTTAVLVNTLFSP
jgi:hypothetical protein